MATARVTVANWLIDLALLILPAGLHQEEFARSIRIYRRRARQKLVRERSGLDNQSELPLSALDEVNHG